MNALLEVQGLSVELPTAAGWVRPVNEVSLRIDAGESLGLVGESGSGKTMLALALMGLLPPGAKLGGQARINGAGAGPGGAGPAPTSSAELQEPGRNLTTLTERQWRDVRGQQIAMVFQEPMTALNPVMRIGPQIEEAIRAHEPASDAGEVRRRMLDALRRAAV